ncbi:MAG: ribosomal-processing cysteine protease Prp [Spirochaetales bacterium]|nr:ribosomal-processing cysteine protease Prp [Spirochaetales bacterium]
MIRAQIDLSEEGAIAKVSMMGHAGYSLKGSDIVCAGATVLLRTFVGLLRTETGVVLHWIKESEGDVGFFVTTVNTHPERYEGWCWYFLRGLEDLAKEFPEYLQVNYGHWKGRLFHGS